MSKERLYDELNKNLKGEDKKRTLKDALKEALDNTTPENPGTVKKRSYDRQDNKEWL